MERNWAYDHVIKKGLEYAQKHGLDLGADIENIDPRDFETYHVIPQKGMIDSIRNARKSGLPWPKDMPFPIVACEGRETCIILDGHHRIEAAKKLSLPTIPAIVASFSTWDRLLPVIEQEDVIPYEDMIAILAEAGNELIRKNLKVEAALREKLEQ